MLDKKKKKKEKIFHVSSNSPYDHCSWEILVAYGFQAWLEIDAVGSHEKMKLCMKLVLGTIPLPSPALTNIRKGKRPYMVILSDILTVKE